MFYSRRHYDRLHPRAGDSKEAGDERRRERALREQAHAETLARFGPLTERNAAEAIAFQEQRIRELLRPS